MLRTNAQNWQSAALPIQIQIQTSANNIDSLIRATSKWAEQVDESFCGALIYLFVQPWRSRLLSTLILYFFGFATRNLHVSPVIPCICLSPRFLVGFLMASGLLLPVAVWSGGLASSSENIKTKTRQKYIQNIIITWINQTKTLNMVSGLSTKES